MRTYCKRVNVESTHVRFLFDGERITEENTP